ncbi:amidohydrolase family protein [Sphingomonas sp. YL-JM2C]
MAEIVDLVIRGGLIADGNGGTPYRGDVFVDGGIIVAVGDGCHAGREEIDAAGKLVTPGFVDIHTHYDGHATWTSRLNPSSSHGVTTVVLGNCGVGFAPCRPDDRERLVKLMEGVEDIPKVVLDDGLPWTWETFPQYLDHLAGRHFDMDIATQLPHAPLRVYVMGERGANREPATAEDIARMRIIAQEAIAAGALGFSTSRSLNHRASDGDPTPSVTAAADELAGIAMGLSDAEAGVVQLISDFDDVDGEFDVVRRIVGESGRPLSLSLMQFPHAPTRWREILDRIEQANKDGLSVRAQVCGRPVGVLAGLELSFNPFSFCASYAPLAKLALAERVERLCDPATRAALLAEFPGTSVRAISRSLSDLDRVFVMDSVPDYEPAAEASIGAQARALGKDPRDHAYDLMLEDGGKLVFYIPAANYVGGSIAAAEEMLRHPQTIYGLGDGGAHCGIVCDASLPTYMLSRWATRGGDGGLPVGEVVRGLTRDTAAMVGLDDRGRVAPGYRADLNVIDMDRIALHRPAIVYDLPSGGGRLNQKSTGYVATVVAGQVTYRDGEPTGVLPGRLVRRARSAQNRDCAGT